MKVRDCGVDREGRRRRSGRVALLIATAVTVGGFSASTALAQDTDPPGTSIIAGPIGLTRDNQPTFTLESDEPNSTFTCKLDANALVPCGPMFYQPAQPLPEGFHYIIAFATDPAGNTDPVGSGREFTIDRSIAGARLAGPRRQRVTDDDLSIRIELRGQEPLTVRVEGVVRIGKRKLPTQATTATIAAKPAIDRRLGANFRTERAIAWALRRGDRVTVKVSARFRDEVGNQESKSRTTVLR